MPSIVIAGTPNGFANSDSGLGAKAFSRGVETEIRLLSQTKSSGRSPKRSKIKGLVQRSRSASAVAKKTDHHAWTTFKLERERDARSDC